jgi:hypothetical protein
METLNAIWQAIYPYVAGVSVTGILSAVIYGCLKGAFSKTISKVNVEKICEDATSKGIDKVKEVSFKQSIQPLCESELKKITEQANDYMKSYLDEMNKKYDQLIEIIEKLSAYFDNSIGVSDTAKEDLKDSINKAKIATTTVETEVVDKTYEEPQESGSKVEISGSKAQR